MSESARKCRRADICRSLRATNNHICEKKARGRECVRMLADLKFGHYKIGDSCRRECRRADIIS
jgi:hypothetical protein